MVDETVELLIERVNDRSLTADGRVGCVMADKAIGIRTIDSFIFRYVTSYNSEIYTIEWPNDTMFANIPAGWVDHLLREGYARLMTADEADVFNDYIKGVKA